MAGRISDDTLQAIRDRVSIVEIVSGYVSLKKAGKNYLGLCPFHAEKTPSFTVNDERGLFHCFGCGVGGTVFTFLTRIERISFPEAVELLARRVGVALPQERAPTAGDDRRQKLIALNDYAQRLFREALGSPAGAPARAYLSQRGLNPSTMERYGLGYCPPNGSGLARACAAKPVALQMAMELGLVGRRQDGSCYERFRGRVMFPIRDGSGRLLGFGGRTLGTDLPKYLNSPESALFHKGKVLYGLYEARDAIRTAERVVVVEGYLDAIALVEAGIGYAVASLGTALTAVQLRLARRFAGEVIVFFDGDRAGQEAALRAVAICAETGVWGRAAFPPETFDPDAFVRQRGAAATAALLDAAAPLADFYFRRMNPGAAATVPQRVRAAQRVAEVLRLVKDPVQFSLLAQMAAQQLSVDESVLRQPPVATAQPRQPSEVPVAAVPGESWLPEEVTLLETMALDSEVALLASHRGAIAAFRSPELAAAARAVVASWEAAAGAEGVIDCLPPPVAARVSAALLGASPLANGDRLQVAHDCIMRIEERERSARAREFRSRLRQAEAAGDDAGVREHLQRAHDLLRRKETVRG
jgi:DNA primase